MHPPFPKEAIGDGGSRHIKPRIPFYSDNFNAGGRVRVTPAPAKKKRVTLERILGYDDLVIGKNSNNAIDHRRHSMAW